MWARRAALLAAAAVALLLCSTEAHGYAFVPITSIMFDGTSSGSAAGDKATCLTKGGYLATEATAVLHSADIAVVQQNIGAATTFYAYLGGGINYVWSNAGGYPGWCPYISTDPELPTDIREATMGNTADCLYRWNVGRWQMMTSDVNVEVDQVHAGIAFYKGQNAGGGSIFGFPMFFHQSSVPQRPGINQGRYVVLYQNTDQTSAGLQPEWSDNYGMGGYTYAGPSGVYTAAASQATLSSFVTLCQGQGPFRLNYEDPNASTPQRSALQYVWWVIFLVILFVLCLIAFLIIACCQEREDMDEPPEDAPEWAEQETEERNVSKRYVSQRSFRGAAPSQSQSTHSSDDRDSRTDSNSSMSKEERYDEEEE